MRLYTTSTKERSNEFLKCAGQREVMQNVSEPVKSGGKKVKCEKRVRGEMCLRQRMKQTLSDMVEVRKQTARETLFSLLGCVSTARGTRAEKSSVLEKKLKIIRMQHE